jgi:excisionase family DNA binding protein
MKSGELGYVKVGTRVLIPRDELLGFVRNHYHKAVD